MWRNIILLLVMLWANIKIFWGHNCLYQSFLLNCTCRRSQSWSQPFICIHCVNIVLWQLYYYKLMDRDSYKNRNGRISGKKLWYTLSLSAWISWLQHQRQEILTQVLLADKSISTFLWMYRFPFLIVYNIFNYL